MKEFVPACHVVPTETAKVLDVNTKIERRFCQTIVHNTVRLPLYNFKINTMKHITSLSAVFCFFLFGSVLHAQDAKQIISQVSKKLQLVRDYSAAVKITIDVDFVKAPETKGMVYFKAPNKFRLKSDGFAMLPKRSVNLSPFTMLSDASITSIYVGSQKTAGVDCHVIKIIPSDANAEYVLSTVYVDKQKLVILRSETTTKKGTINMDISYGSTIQYALPQSVTFQFDVPKFELPKSMTGDVHKKDTSKNRATGSVTLSYSNYQVNKGVDDSVFAEQSN